MNFMIKYLIYILIILAVIIVYHPILNTFYYQDEWLGYGSVLSKGSDSIFENSKGIAGLLLGEGRILTNLAHFIFYKYFPLNVYPFAISAIIIHSINSILVFLLAKKIFKNTTASFIGSLFFIFNSLHLSAISWPAASINTLPSTTLILMGLLAFFQYLTTNKSRWMVVSFVLTYLSLFFKETGIFLLVLIPLSLFFYRNVKIYILIKKFWYFFLPSIFIVLYRLYGFKSTDMESALFATGASKYFTDAILVRSFFYPLTSFSLSLFHPSYILTFARYITNVFYPFIPESQFILVAQTIVLDLISVIATFTISAIIFVMVKFEKFKNYKNILFWLLFLTSSFLPYVIIGKSFSYLESRYYYLSSIAWSMIISWVFIYIKENIKFKIVKICLLSVYILFIGFNVKLINLDLKSAVIEAQQRINILNQIINSKPKLNEKINVFYVTGDMDYYLVGHKVPFQQGFGYTLLTYYFKKSEYPKEFLSNTKLFEIGSQGYEEINGLGFGYFSDIKLMEEEVKKYNILNKNIYKFYYNSKTTTINEI